MGLHQIVVWGYRCLRCDGEWVPKGLELEEDGSKPEEPFPKPSICPRCYSRLWDTPRRYKMPKNAARSRGKKSSWKDLLKASQKV